MATASVAITAVDQSDTNAGNDASSVGITIIRDFDTYAASLSPYIWYKFNEASGAIVDYGSRLGNGTTNNVTYGEPALVTGYGTQECLTFSNSDSYVLIPAMDQEVNTGFTVSILCQPDSYSVDGDRYFEFVGGLAAIFVNNTQDGVSAWMNTSGATLNVDTSNIPAAGSPYWIHITWNGDTYDIYFDSGSGPTEATYSQQETLSGLGVTAVALNTVTAKIGNRSANARPFYGDMDEFLMFDKVLTTTEMQALGYYSMISSAYTPYDLDGYITTTTPYIYYKFDEASGAVIDYGSFSGNGTVNNLTQGSDSVVAFYGTQESITLANSDSYVTVPAIDTELNDAYSVSMLCKASSITVNGDRLFEFANNKAAILFNNTQDGIKGWQDATVGIIEFDSTGIPSTGVPFWIHVTWDGEWHRVWLDTGSGPIEVSYTTHQSVTSTGKTLSTMTGETFKIGNRISNSRQFNGDIDVFVMWDSVISETVMENLGIQSTVSEESTPAPPAMTTYEQFVHDTGPTIWMDFEGLADDGTVPHSGRSTYYAPTETNIITGTASIGSMGTDHAITINGTGQYVDIPGTYVPNYEENLTIGVLCNISSTQAGTTNPYLLGWSSANTPYIYRATSTGNMVVARAGQSAGLSRSVASVPEDEAVWLFFIFRNQKWEIWIADSTSGLYEATYTTQDSLGNLELKYSTEGLGLRFFNSSDGLDPLIGVYDEVMVWEYGLNEYQMSYIAHYSGIIASEPTWWSQTVYVNGSTGSDSNDGLSSGAAKATIDAGITTALTYRTAGTDVRVLIADGTYRDEAWGTLNNTGAGHLWIVGETDGGVIIDGSNVWDSGWTTDGNGYWQNTGYTNNWGTATDNWPGITQTFEMLRSDGVWVDSVHMRQVENYSDLAAAADGSFHVDEGTNTLTIKKPTGATTPGSHTIEVCEYRKLGELNGMSNLRFMNLRVQHYGGNAGTEVGSTALQIDGSVKTSCWIINCSFKENIGAGFCIDECTDDVYLKNVRTYQNGWLGHYVRSTRNLVATQFRPGGGNSWKQIDQDLMARWSSGTKWLFTHVSTIVDLVYTDDYSEWDYAYSNGEGPYLWLDWNHDYTTFIDADIDGSTYTGLYLEASRRVVMRNPIFKNINAGQASSGAPLGGILLSACQNFYAEDGLFACSDWVVFKAGENERTVNESWGDPYSDDFGEINSENARLVRCQFHKEAGFDWEYLVWASRPDAPTAPKTYLNSWIWTDCEFWLPGYTNVFYLYKFQESVQVDLAGLLSRSDGSSSGNTYASFTPIEAC